MQNCSFLSVLFIVKWKREVQAAVSSTGWDITDMAWPGWNVISFCVRLEANLFAEQEHSLVVLYSYAVDMLEQCRQICNLDHMSFCACFWTRHKAKT